MTVPTGEDCLLDYAAVCRALHAGLTRCGLERCSDQDRRARVTQGYRLVWLWRGLWVVGGGLTLTWMVWR